MHFLLLSLPLSRERSRAQQKSTFFATLSECNILRERERAIPAHRCARARHKQQQKTHTHFKMSKKRTLAPSPLSLFVLWHMKKNGKTNETSSEGKICAPNLAHFGNSHRRERTEFEPPSDSRDVFCVLCCFFRRIL